MTSTSATSGRIPQEPDYRIRWASFDNRTGTTQSVSEEATTAERRTSVPRDAWGPPDAAGLRYAGASIATIERAFPHWAEPVLVAIRNRAGALDVVGVERPTGAPAQPRKPTPATEVTSRE